MSEFSSRKSFIPRLAVRSLSGDVVTPIEKWLKCQHQTIRPSVHQTAQQRRNWFQVRAMTSIIYARFRMSAVTSNLLVWVLLFQFFPCMASRLLASSSDDADRFPSLQDSMEMVVLSDLVYRFKEDGLDCDTYSSDDGTKCELYCHNLDLGTQLLLVSNQKKRYYAIVFAGTDDLRTSLEDADLVKKPFGNNSTVSLKDPNIKVHSGFNNAVFSHGVWDELYKRVRQFKYMHPSHKLWTTGHSLGAANSVLTATALALKGYHVTSVNFGCPQIGNMGWRNFFHTSPDLKSRLSVWRIVLGWDLVPRLPDFFYHAGHTIQLWSENDQKYDGQDPNLVEAYYQHYGNAKLRYAGVPSGWSVKPYEWVPGALSSHHLVKYVEFMKLLEHSNYWVESFKTMQPIGYDDDIYDEPPDDWYVADFFAAT